MATDGPSEHLSWEEMACRDEARTPYPQQWRAHRGAQVGWAFEAFRAMVGHYRGVETPLAVLSGYRTREHNAQEGGAPDSQHIHGRAIDVARPKGMRRSTFHNLAILCAKDRESLIRGLGLYPDYVHLDIRPGRRLCRWGRAA